MNTDIVPAPHSIPLPANEAWVLEMVRRANLRVSSRWEFFTEDQYTAGEVQADEIKERNPTVEAVGLYDPASFSHVDPSAQYALFLGTEFFVIRER